MNSSDIPTRLPIRFGENAGGGYIHPIPVASQIGITDGAASLHDGFVPLNATPIGAGGVPPDIKDMNGILYEMSAWTRWQAAGGPVFFDGTFASAVGGYPAGALLASTTPGVFWANTVDGNLTDPDGGSPVGWVHAAPPAGTLAEFVAGTVTDKFLSPAVLSALRASSAEILAGTDARKYLTASAFYGARADAAAVETGTDDHKYITPAALAAAFAATGTLPFSMNLPGGFSVKVMQDTFPDVPAGGVGYAATTNYPTPFPTGTIVAGINTRTTSGTICNWNASTTAWDANGVSWRVQEWAAAVNPGGVTIWAIGH